MLKVTDFIDLEEIDNDDAKMRVIAESFSGDVKTWFHNLAPNSITNPQQLADLLFSKWEEKKNPLQILVEYDALRRNPNESVQDFTARFNKIYNSIPNDIKPPPGLDLLHYMNAFDPNMDY
jgi:hypothetical protein